MIFETIKLALSGLWSHKLRTTLTLLGLAIGVTSVIAIISALEGMMTHVAGLVNTWGASTVIVTKFGIITSEEEWRKAVKRKKITIADARAIKQGCPLVKAVGVRKVKQVKLKYGNRSMFGVTAEGMSANAMQILDVDVIDGRFYSDFDDDHRKQVAVIGPTVKEQLFPYENPIGKTITVEGFRFQVIGIGKEFGAVFGDDHDRYVWVPINTALKLTGRHVNVGIACKVVSDDKIDEAMDQIRTVMRSRRHVAYNDPDDFALLTSEQIMDFFNEFTKNARVIAIGIPFISIIVAGIVVMNIMMVSVTERTREIGIRKAIGARRRNILSQFMYEAVIMSMMGGLLGLIAGLYLSSFLTDWMGVAFVISGFAIGAGLAIPACIGIFFGIYPAWKASKLDPIEAMRFE